MCNPNGDTLCKTRVGLESFPAVSAIETGEKKISYDQKATIKVVIYLFSDLLPSH